MAALICASPAILLWDGLITLGIVAEVIAIALVITAGALRPRETEFLISVTRQPLAIAAIPAVWILIQALPLGLMPHPIWKSAAAALGHPLAASISVDPGASIIALGQYLSLAAAAFLSAAVALDRQRAEWVFFALALATTVIALLSLTHGLYFSGPWLTACAHDQAVDCSAIGAITASAACLRSIERYEIRKAADRSALALPLALAGPGTALVICGAALLLFAALPTVFATVYGLVALVCVALIRRFDLGGLGVTGLTVIAIGVAVLLLAAHPTERGTTVLLSFAASSPSLKSLSQHLLDDAPLVGTGARTFTALASAYRAITDPPLDCSSATAAATFAIELGRPLLWLIVFGTLTGAIVLLRDSLQRGRDWVYPALGGSCLLAMLLLSFTNAGLLGTTTGLLMAAVLGLAFAQSKSRTAK
jgi:hypothetical protein